jgi:hypothetical protein
MVQQQREQEQVNEQTTFIESEIKALERRDEN